MTFDFVSAPVRMRYGTIFRPTIFLNGPDLTDIALILSLAGFVWALGENSLCVSL